MQRVLYVDDEIENLFTLEMALKRWFQVSTLSDPTKALDVIREQNIHVLVTDQRMPRISGLELAKIVQEHFPSVVIIILTAYDDNDTILQAINQGGIFRYLLKPWNIQDLRQTLSSAFEAYELRRKNFNLINDLVGQVKKLQVAYDEISLLKQKLEEENIQLKDEYLDPNLTGHIVGNSKPIKAVLRQLHLAARSDSTVLLLGETGTGKELFANAIHSLSSRKGNLLVKVNCAAIPEPLIESELFGHKKGAYTGADKLKHGKVELAHLGTLFLDEIGELPLTMQPKLLRVLQEFEFERVGGNRVIKTDFRLVAATNRNLEQAVENGAFRSDLYYRLNIFPITIPPLRDHIEDVPLLVEHFVSLLNRRTGRRVNAIPKKAIEKLITYHWPGNIRELQNVVERAHVLSPNSKLDIGNWFAPARAKSGEATSITSLEQNERDHILKALRQTKWKIRGLNGAAEILQINPTTLESRMKKLGIERPL